MKEISLTKGLFAVVDDEDYEWLSRWKWHACRGGDKQPYYARRAFKRNGKVICVPMSRQIMSASGKEVVDHINHDTLDNRRSNLRLLSRNGLNRLNCGVHRSNRHSKYKGVHYYKPAGTWVANFCGSHIGYFLNEVDAAMAYNARAYEEYGDLVKLNDIDGFGRVTTYPGLCNRKRRKSRYRGVRRKSDNCWEATIQVGNVRRVLGYSATENCAAVVYNNACERLGVPHRKNVIEEG